MSDIAPVTVWSAVYSFPDDEYSIGRMLDNNSITFWLGFNAEPSSILLSGDFYSTQILTGFRILSYPIGGMAEIYSEEYYVEKWDTLAADWAEILHVENGKTASEELDGRYFDEPVETSKIRFRFLYDGLQYKEMGYGFEGICIMNVYASEPFGKFKGIPASVDAMETIRAGLPANVDARETIRAGLSASVNARETIRAGIKISVEVPNTYSILLQGEDVSDTVENAKWNRSLEFASGKLDLTFNAESNWLTDSDFDISSSVQFRANNRTIFDGYVDSVKNNKTYQGPTTALQCLDNADNKLDQRFSGTLTGARYKNLILQIGAFCGFSAGQITCPDGDVFNISIDIDNESCNDLLKEICVAQNWYFFIDDDGNLIIRDDTFDPVPEYVFDYDEIEIEDSGSEKSSIINLLRVMKQATDDNDVIIGADFQHPQSQDKYGIVEGQTVSSRFFLTEAQIKTTGDKVMASRGYPVRTYRFNLIGQYDLRPYKVIEVVFSESLRLKYVITSADFSLSESDERWTIDVVLVSQMQTALGITFATFGGSISSMLGDWKSKVNNILTGRVESSSASGSGGLHECYIFSTGAIMSNVWGDELYEPDSIVTLADLDNDGIYIIISGTRFSGGDWKSYTYTAFQIESINVLSSTEIEIEYTDDFDEPSALALTNYSIEGAS